jgi:hypothetical protein
MPVSWVLSGHGYVAPVKKGAGAPESTRAYPPPGPVPPGVRLYFFVDEGAPLDVNEGWRIYRLLMKKLKTPEDLDNIQAIPGLREHDQPTVPNYVLTGDGSWTDSETKLSASGIFVMGDQFHQDSRKRYISPNAPTPLGKICSMKMLFRGDHVTVNAGDSVYWVACRCWVS